MYPDIWLINHYSGNLEHGMEYRHFFLARHLVKLGHKVTIISASFHHLYTKPPSVEDSFLLKEVDGVQFLWIKVPRYEGNGVARLWNTVAFTARLVFFSNRITRLIGRPGIVMGSTPHPFIVMNLMHLKRKFKVPVIFEVRDLWPLMLVELGSISARHPLSKLFGWLERIAYRNSDLVISLWHSADQYMFAQGLEKDRFAYLPNGIELSDNGEVESVTLEHPLNDEIRSLRKQGYFIVGYAGSHGLANPLECIVQACIRLREHGIDDVLFYLVGEGPDKARIVEMAEQHELQNLRFYEYVNKDVIMGFYQEIDVAYMGLKDLPLFKYGPTPNKLMDYLASAKPVIYGINSSFDPVTGIGAGVKVKPDSPEELVTAVLELKSKSVLERKKMGQAGLLYAREELNFKSLATKLHKLCTQLTTSDARC
ncbi:glycosyl transferase, group 1 [Oleiphilus messinensis]|uniref:Glycosyl transferase, group 1 n=1 Tax=Oleiphilus messinensis TaxID=141451 RepID=A0A1Y0IJB1_9GAMM|nr:glycosyltransferase family 4 protein [Oleiphilus messinensis]ARU59523.1 glycosyl transferase, group 1 [Oleiphilus messinensis]